MSRATVSIPRFPYVARQSSGGAIEGLRLPPKNALEHVWAVLVTHEDMRPFNPNHFGDLRFDRLGLRAAYHMLLSILVSNRNNRAGVFAGWEDMSSAQLVVRLYYPQPDNPDVFAILLQAALGAQGSPVHSTELPNVHYEVNDPVGGTTDTNTDPEASVEGRNPGIADVLDTGMLKWSIGRGAGPPPIDAEEGASNGAGGGGSKEKRSTQICISSPTRYVSDLFNASRQTRLRRCSNFHQLLYRAESTAGQNEPWNLIWEPHGSRLSEMEYIRHILKELVVCTGTRRYGEMTTQSIQRAIDETQRLDVKRYESELLCYAPKTQRTEFDVALGLPNALCRLDQYLAKYSSNSHVRATWAKPEFYASAATQEFASPVGVQTFVMAARSDSPTLGNFLRLELPRYQRVRDVLLKADVQVSLVQHRHDVDLLALADAVSRLGLDDGQLWFSRLGERLRDVVRRSGSLSCGRDVPNNESELMALVYEIIGDTRKIASEVGELSAQTKQERTLLLDPRAPVRPWEQCSLFKKSISDLLALWASQRDNNAILDASAQYFESYVDSANQQPVDVANELVNFRECMARFVYADLVDGAALLARLAAMLRLTSGLVSTWREALLAMLTAHCSFLDLDDRCHIEFEGNAASGKSMLVGATMRSMPANFYRENVYESKAAMRDTDETLSKNQVFFKRESGRHDEDSSDDRAVRLSRFTEDTSESVTIAMQETTAPPFTKIRAKQRSVMHHRFSMISASNLPITDPALATRIPVVSINPLSVSGKIFGEADAEAENTRAIHQPLVEKLTRALHFFTRCVAAFCMLVNGGVVTLPSNEVNIAVINYILPHSTNASDVRRYKQFYKLSRMLDVWTATYRFLALPFSPLTLIHGDRLSLAALAGIRAYMFPACSSGIFVGSLSPSLNRDLMLRRVVDFLLQKVLVPEQSIHTQARRAFRERLLNLDRSYNARYALLEALPELFRHPSHVPDQPGSHSDGGHREDSLVYFRYESMWREAGSESASAVESRYLNPGTGRGSNSGHGEWVDAGESSFFSARPAHETMPDESTRHGFEDPWDIPALGAAPRESSNSGSAHAGITGVKPVATSSSSRPSIPIDQRLRPLVKLTGGDEEAAWVKITESVTYWLQHEAKVVGLNGSTTSSASRSRKRGLNQSSTRGASGGNNSMWETEIRDAFERVHLRLYRDGWASVDVHKLYHDDNYRVTRKVTELVQTYQVPVGGYLLFNRVNPEGDSRVEAFEVVESIERPDRKFLDDLLNVEGGRDIARRRQEVALRLVAGCGATLPDLEALMPRQVGPASWRETAKTSIRTSGLELQAGTHGRRVMKQLVPDLPSEEALDVIHNLVCLGLEGRMTSKTAAVAEQLIGRANGSGVSQWQPGQIQSGRPHTYHHIELHAHRIHQPMPTTADTTAATMDAMTAAMDE